MTPNLLPQLREQFQNQVAIHEKRPGTYQISVPLYHEDGDMVDLYVQDAPEPGLLRVFDAGMTFMRLSYAIEDMTPAREKVWQRMLAEAHVLEDDGNLHLDVLPASLVPALLQLAQAEARLGAIRHFRREIIAGLFTEEFGELVQTLLGKFQPVQRFQPLEGHDEWEVDFELTVGSHKTYLFGVKDVGKARLTALTCRQFQADKLQFRSAVVHEDMLALPKKDQARLTSAADKQFPSLDDFRANAVAYFEREAG